MSLLGGGFSDAYRTDKNSDAYVVSTDYILKLSQLLSITDSSMNFESFLWKQFYGESLLITFNSEHFQYFGH